jgi:putative SOS response-associated peptidase YedK
VPRWLDPTLTEVERVSDLLGPYPASEMESRAVSRRVSNPDHEGPELIQPDDSTPELWT